MFRKGLSILVSTLVIVSMLTFTAGCSKNGDKGDSGTASQATSGDAGQNGGGSVELPIVKDKLTLSILSETRADIQLGNDMPTFKELEKRTNIHLDWQLLPVTNSSEKFNLIMASGNFPDIVAFGNLDSVIKFGTQGAFIPLQELIKKHAPNIKTALDKPLTGEKLPYKIDAWNVVTADDGNVYTIPSISASNAIGPLYGIRTDWLEKLGLKVPETPDELYTVLKAFKERDPNGNGKQDELPFISAQGNKTSTVLPLVNAFGGHMGLYVDEKDDKIKFGPVEPQFKEGLKYLNKLYKEGLLESDYLSSTRDQWLAKSTGNLSGFMFLQPSSGFAAANAGLQKLDPSYKIMPMLPLKSADGKRIKDTATTGRVVICRTSITKSNKHPVETMKYLNYLFSEEGTTLASYGIEGTHYTKENGKPVYTDLITKNPNGLDPETARIKDGIIWLGLPFQIGWECHFQAMKSTAPWTVKAMELYREPGMLEATFPALKFTEDEFSRRNQIMTEIDTYRNPMIDKFIMGAEPLDKFDEFVSKINKSGLEELLKISNDSYLRYKKAGSK